METMTLQVEGLALTLCPGEGNRLVLFPGEAASLEEAISLCGLSLPWVAVEGFDWNRDLSPWAAKGVFARNGDFPGGGDAFLDTLVNCVLPIAEEKLGLQHPCRSIIGYSLAGLFAVYALYRTDVFAKAASVSGSLWFDGFRDYAATHPFARQPEKVYLSLGDREPNVWNPRLHKVGEDTMAFAALLEERGLSHTLVWNPGNHFVHVGQRLADALTWLES